MYYSENRHMGVKCGLNHKKRQYISKMTVRHYHLQKKCAIHEYQEKLLVSVIIFKIMVWFFTITSDNILCGLLVMFLLNVHHVAVLNV